MRVAKLRCDECKTEVEEDGAGHWYRVSRYGSRELLLEYPGDIFDLCSLPCVVAWAGHRELVRVAS